MNQRPAVDSEAQNSATKPAVLATFYVDKKKEGVTKEIRELLCRELGLVQERPGMWRTPKSEEAFLIRFDPRATPDATVLQLALNAPGDVGKAWEICREQLEKWLNPEALDGIWGYTLTYQAILNPGSDLEGTFEKLRAASRPLHSGKGPYAPLVQADVDGGLIWLMAAPTGGDGRATGTVYVALGEPEREEDLDKVFLGNGAEFLMPELIAHKSYYQRRQYRGEKLEEYERHLDGFRQVVRRLLHELERRKVETGYLSEQEISDLTQHYHDLAGMVWQLEDLRVSMARQLHNYDEWEITKENDILRYHRRYIETTKAELELLVSDGRSALGVADPVLSISRYRTEKAQEKEEARNLQRIQNLLLVLAVVVPAAIALPELVDKDVARGVILVAVLAMLIWLVIWVGKGRQDHESKGAEIHETENQ